jgi:cyclic di-GMP phosphodiesterase
VIFDRRRRVLIVDDDALTARMLQRALSRCGYHVELAHDGFEALAKIRLTFDLVLLDASMPGLDGFEVARRIRQAWSFRDLPILMLTGSEGQSFRRRAVDAGVNDFLAKPFDLAALHAMAEPWLRGTEESVASRRLASGRDLPGTDHMAELRRALDETVDAQRATYHAHLDTIRRLILAAEYKDSEVGAHIERIGAYAELLGRGLNLAPQEVELLRYASPMHDVGKIGIPDGILRKTGKLDTDEWAVMKQHTTIGARILAGSPSRLLQAGELIALSHHERYDGTGYPRGLSGDAIPLYGRICAIADVFDALTTDRPYRARLSSEKAREVMGAGRGRQFDPALLDVFLSQTEAVETIQKRLEERS